MATPQLPSPAAHARELTPPAQLHLRANRGAQIWIKLVTSFWRHNGAAMDNDNNNEYILEYI